MAYDVIDLISSSPPPSGSVASDHARSRLPVLPAPTSTRCVSISPGPSLRRPGQGPQPTLLRRHGLSEDIEDFDDSISDSRCSNDDDLPAITDMDLSKPRVRSPLRRWNSDLTSSKTRVARSTGISKQARVKRTAPERDADREQKRRDREQLKAAKMAERLRAAAVAEVNKLRTDKKISTPEMIVDLPRGLSSELQIQIEEMLGGVGVEHATWNSPVIDFSIIKWRRKVTSKFNDNLGLWEPVPPRIMDEESILVILPANVFVAMALNGCAGERLAHIKTRCNGKKVILLLQGMTTWFRQNRNNRNRQFVSGVRSASGETALVSRTSTGHVDENIIEDAMLAIQVDHDVLIHHTTVATETARWVIHFTQHISTIPYKKQRDHATSVAGFCMESGQVRTGNDGWDTYIRLLQEIARVTPPIAFGVAAEYSTVGHLVRGLEHGGPGRLEAVKKTMNKNGALSDRSIGQAVSRRLYKVFTGRDEDSTDV